MTAQDWRVLVSRTNDAALNLAIDESLIRGLAERRTPNTIRIWQSRASVIIGCSQDPRAEVNIKACRKLGIPVLRRSSGGGAVYVDLGCYNYSVVAHLEAIPGPMTVPAVYRFICSAVMNAVLHFGFSPMFVPPSSIFVEGKKVSGSAQRLVREGMLQHGTLLVDSNLEIMQAVLSPDIEMAGLVHSVPSRPAPVANLADLTGRHLGRSDVRRAMIDALTSLFARPWKRGSLSRKEHSMARRLLRHRYIDLAASTS